jgi:hypothetical protein
MLPDRTEDEIIGQLPITVKFGDKEYKIKPLTILKARKWRENLIGQIQTIAAALKQDTNTSEVFVSGLAFVFLSFPEKMADLIFTYAPDLPKETIEEEGTEEQMSRVFGQIVQVAFPFLGELKAMSQTLGLASSFPASEKSTKPQ